MKSFWFGVVMLLTVTMTVLLFASFTAEAPDALGWLKGEDSSASVGTPPNAGGLATSEYLGWTIRKQGSVVELVTATVVTTRAGRSVQGVLGVLCTGAKLDMRWDVGREVAGGVAPQVTLGPLSREAWLRGPASTLFPRSPSNAVRALLENERVVPLHANLEDGGPAGGSLNLTGLGALARTLPGPCQVR